MLVFHSLRSAACGLMLGTVAAVAQSYPVKPIRLVVPFAAGGITDIAGRLFADRMSQALGQPVVIENRAGVGSRIGADFVAKAPNDGNTVLFSNSVTHGILSATEKALSYDPVKDFVPVVALASYAVILVVHRSVPAINVAELIAHARANPGKLNYASAGPGSGVHFAAELFRRLANVDMVHVPYKRSGPTPQAVIAGNAQFTFDGAAKPAIDAGRVRALGVLDHRRDVRFPNLPTVEEAGLQGCVLVTRQGLAVPAGTPSKVVARLNAAGNASLSDAKLQARMGELGLNPVGGTAQRLGEIINEDIALYRRIAADAKLTFN